MKLSHTRVPLILAVSLVAATLNMPNALAVRHKKVIKSGQADRARGAINKIKSGIKTLTTQHRQVRQATTERNRLLKAGLRALSSKRLRAFIPYEGITIAEKKSTYRRDDSVQEYRSSLVLTRDHGLGIVTRERTYVPKVSGLKVGKNGKVTGDIKMVESDRAINNTADFTHVRGRKLKKYEQEDKDRSYDTTYRIDGTEHRVGGYSRYVSDKHDLNMLADQVGLTSLRSVSNAMRGAEKHLQQASTKKRRELKTLGVTPAMFKPAE